MCLPATFIEASAAAQLYIAILYLRVFAEVTGEALLAARLQSRLSKKAVAHVEDSSTEDDRPTPSTARPLLRSIE